MTAIRTTLIALLLFSCGDPGPTSTVTAPAFDSTRTTVSSSNGLQKLPTKDGGHMEGMMQDGKRTGGWVSFFPDGTIQSKANYANGIEVGPTEVYHPNGQVYYTGQYVDGIPFGEWVFYGLDGKELKRVEYDSSGVVKK